MAISFIASSKATGATVANVSPAIPTGSTTDDFMIATCVMDLGNTDPEPTWTETASSGWTNLGYASEDTEGRDRSTAIFYKKHSGSESTPTFQHNADTNDATSAIITSFRGVDTSTPFDVTYVDGSHHTSAANDALPTNPAITTASANSWVFLFAHVTHDDISAWGAPTGYTLRDSIVGNDGGGSVFYQQAVATKLVASAGTETPGEWGNTASDEITGENTVITLALRAAVASSNNRTVASTRGLASARSTLSRTIASTRTIVS